MSSKEGLKHVEVTFVDNTIRRFEDVIDGTFETKGTFMRFKNLRGETLYIHQDKILMFSVSDMK